MAAIDTPAPPTVEAPDGGPSTPTRRPGKSPHRYSAFDIVSSFANGSPTQTKTILEAHIADTDRRIRDASKLGTNLLDQKKKLSDRLQDVVAHQGEQEISPELRQQLEELGREFDDLGRESARSLLPKARSNGEATNGSGVFSNERSASPTKPSAPLSSRKQRNTSSRVEDLTFATEISTSLLGQVRHLQNVLAEKEEALRQANGDNARMQSEAEHVNARFKAFDDNEQRYKDENWQLDTQVQDLSAQVQEATNKHQRLEQSLMQVQSERSTLESETEDLRTAHGELKEEHAKLRKKHDTELAGLRRNLTAGDTDKETLQAKIANLTSQNEELARAVGHRMRTEPTMQPPGAFMESEDELRDQITPEHSPPPSPTKGTPRHGALESETLKSSLHHAHRMIQNLKNNIHREKTEKLELRRMLQDARDEVEVRRADGGAGTRNKPRKQDSDRDLFKRPTRPDRLGMRQNASEEIIDDPSWEEYDESPSRQPIHRKNDFSTDTSDAFETANEAEFNTETDAFETAESAAGDTEGEETETEATHSSTNLRKRPSRIEHMHAGSRSSFLSTASDDGDAFDVQTPPRNERQPYKLRMNRDRLREPSETPDARGSPASFVSNSSSSQLTPKNDLAAELRDFGDGSSVADSTPSRSIVSNSSQPTPEDERKRDTQIISRSVEASLMPRKPQMVDSGMLTEPWEPEKSNTAEAGVVGAVAGTGTAGLAALGLRSNDRDQDKVADGARPGINFDREAGTLARSKSNYVDQGYQQSPAAAPGTFTDRNISEAPQTIPPAFGFSTLQTQDTAPVTSPAGHTQALPDVASAPAITPKAPDLSLQETSPIAFWFSGISSQQIKPVQPTLSRNQSSLTSPSRVRESRSMQNMETSPATINDMTSTPSKPAPSMAFVDRMFGRSPHATPSPPSQSTTMPPSVGLQRTPFVSSMTPPRRDRPVDDVFVSESARASPSGNENTSQAAPALASDEERTPFKPVSGNNSPKKTSSTGLAPNTTRTEGTQTIVSAEEIDRVTKDKEQQHITGAAGSTIPNRPDSASNAPPELTERSPRRPSVSSVQSVQSVRKVGPSSPPLQIPPLPTDHRELIAAASRTSSMQGNSNPPNFSVPSKTSNQQLRPRTPSGTFQQGTSPQRTFNTVASPSQRNRGPPPVMTGKPEGSHTRRSSVSSFASEVDERFAPNSIFPDYDPTNTDPRMIQAITQTMIGEFMWKYTRKTGSSSTQSSNRHRRFFWIHPYTRTLYWSTQDPSRMGQSRSELKAKSVPIDAVRVVTDSNPNPPGLWQKSIVILTPGKNGRSIKFTAPTGMRHETWFNALSYLLLRNNASDRVEDTSDQAATAAYASMRSSSWARTMRNSTTTLNNTRNYTDTSPSHPRSTDNTNTLASLTADDVSEFNPTLHPSGRGTSSRITGSSSYRSLRSQRRSDTTTSSYAGSPRRAQNQTPSLTARQGAAAAAASSVGGTANSTAYTSANNTAPTTAFSTPTKAKDVNAIPGPGPTAGAGVGTTTGLGLPLQSSTADQIFSDDAEPEVDSQGFKKPARPTGAGRTSRLGSMTSRSRAAVGNLFGRKNASSEGESASRGVAVDDASQTSQVSQSSQASNFSQATTERGRASGEEYFGADGHQRGASAGGSGRPGSWGRSSVTVENVRACCDGKHDVAHLSHTASTSHRSRHSHGNGSVGGRYSQSGR